MGLIGLVSRSICNLSAFIYPSYASYKALISYDHLQTERWLVYWTCIGAITGLESTVSWILAWVPFYSEIKLLFVLWLVAPQSEGSTFLYKTYIAPFFESHEADVDSALRNLRSLGGTWLQKGLVWAWKMAREQLNLAAVLPESPPFNKTQPAANPVLTGHLPPQPSDQPSPSFPIPPSIHRPQSSPAVPVSDSIHQPPDNAYQHAFSMASNLVQQYGPIALAAGQSHFGLGGTGSRTDPALSSSSARSTVGDVNVRQRRSVLEPEQAGSTSRAPTPDSSRSASSSALGKSGYEEIRKEDAWETEEGARPWNTWLGGWGGHKDATQLSDNLKTD